MLDNLYTDIGGKLKGLAKGFFICGTIAAAIGAFLLVVEDIDMLLYGVLLLVGGALGAWFFSWLIYGFGEVIDNLDALAYNTYHDDDGDTPTLDNSPKPVKQSHASHALRRFSNNLR